MFVGWGEGEYDEPEAESGPRLSVDPNVEHDEEDRCESCERHLDIEGPRQLLLKPRARPMKL